MKELKLYDLCVIKEIADCDRLWYAHKDLLVGKMVRYEGEIGGPVELPGFIACCVVFVDPVPELGFWKDRPSCFYCVKLEKIET
jgi:hypothetical protein